MYKNYLQKLFTICTIGKSDRCQCILSIEWIQTRYIRLEQIWWFKSYPVRQKMHKKDTYITTDMKNTKAQLVRCKWAQVGENGTCYTLIYSSGKTFSSKTKTLSDFHPVIWEASNPFYKHWRSHLILMTQACPSTYRCL